MHLAIKRMFSSCGDIIYANALNGGEIGSTINLEIFYYLKIFVAAGGNEI